MPGAQSEEYLKRLAANPALENIISFPKGGAVKANPLYEKQKELFTTILTDHPEKQQMVTQSGLVVEEYRPSDEILKLQQQQQHFMANPQNMVTILNPTASNINNLAAFNNPILAYLTDPTKIKRKINVPANQTFNFTGLIIGPKGSNQKRLEEETGCKILVRGKGSQKEGMPPQPDDNEPQHILIVGDTENQIARATSEIEKILFADDETRNRIRQEQLKIVAQIKNDPSQSYGSFGIDSSGMNLTFGSNVDLSLTTPYGPPSQDAFIIPVPNDCVGLVIGKGGETIKMLQVNSGASKVQVAADSAPNSNTRNVFVEGDRESIDKVKRMLQEIVEAQQKLKSAMTGMSINGQSRLEYPVPNNLVGLIIGRGGETVKGINTRSGAFVFIPKECPPGSDERVLVITGQPEQIQIAQREIEELVNMGLKNMALKQQSILPSMMMGGALGLMGDPSQYGMPGGGMDPMMLGQGQPFMPQGGGQNSAIEQASYYLSLIHI
eukprot:TRINITY_DN1910_c0_g1_i2.p1 TRINITY_DN1910_c0_g1~~TRINITY_DN1910_c0_g1_i2.p1  ORF type:complete len:496 (+),score=81.54 TRINITY_DN1910_c0_g1_i2:284-1771(+)